jgi:hypothetical protein
MTTAKSGTKTYKNHKLGSRKSKVHEAFDKKGSEVAWTLGQRLKLKEGTLRSWFGAWARDTGKATPAKKSPTKKKADSANVEVS